jgi:hypothetical protein
MVFLSHDIMRTRSGLSFGSAASGEPCEHPSRTSAVIQNEPPRPTQAQTMAPDGRDNKPIPTVLTQLDLIVEACNQFVAEGKGISSAWLQELALEGWSGAARRRPTLPERVEVEAEVAKIIWAHC